MNKNKPITTRQGESFRRRSTFMISGSVRNVKRRLGIRFAETLAVWRHIRQQRRVTISLFVLLAAEVITVAQPLFMQPSYALGNAGSLLAPSSPSLAERLKYDATTKTFDFNEGYVAAPKESAQSPAPSITATAHETASEGMTVTDPALKTSFSMKPRFGLHDGRRSDNRVVYPLTNKKGWLVYGMHSTSVKEDVILTESPGNRYELEYELKLNDGMEARLEADGSIGVYGNVILSGDVTTGSDKDAELLDKARKNAPKQNLLFSIPAPVVIEHGKDASAVKSKFLLDGSTLRVVTDGLDRASYPLSIDPSIYVETAAKFMRGNNETNVDFDVQDTLIQKGKTTGARFDQLSPTMALPDGRWGHGTAAAGGYVYAAGGSNGTGTQSSLHWAKFSASNSAISSPNPGNGSCSSWCTSTAYALPAPRTGLSLVAYNGFLYAIGGEDSGCTALNGTGAGGICNTVYITKIGANGEPSLWHPTDPNQGNWTYWQRAGNLTSTRSYSAAVAYQNRLYLVGGKNDLDLGGVTTVEAADIRPNGTLSNWTTTGMSPLPVGAGRQHHSVEIYNDRLYVIGGVDGTVETGNIVRNVFYTRLVNGATNGWSQTNSLSAPRMSWGGSFTAVWGGHIYQTGGCSAVNLSGYCTAIEQSTQFASINMAGNLTQWRDMNGVTNQFIGHSIEIWNGAVYRIGGCTLQDATTGACTSTASSTGYALINSPGDITAVSSSSASGSGTCSGISPYDCHLPPVGDLAAEGGQLLAATVAMKGYLYVIGGCTDAGCGSASGNVAYARISATGTLTKPTTCPAGSYYGAWCVDSTNRVNGTIGVAAAGVATYGKRIYIVGGTDGAGNTNTLYHTTVNDNGSLAGAWTSQPLSGVGGVGAASVAHTFAYARANPNQAATTPANLYIFGGCGSTLGAACTSGSYSSGVYKCNIQTGGSVSGCTTTDQLQIDSESAFGTQGIGMHTGTVFADYLYLIGGASQTTASRNGILYAKFNDSNNVVAQTGSQWVQAPSTLSTGRSASASFSYNGYLYVIGGFNSGTNTVLGSVETAKINAIDGSIGSFATSNTGVGARWGMTVGVSSSTAYVLGGCSAGAGTCTTLDASFRSIQIHNNESGAPENYTPATNLFTTDRIAASAAVLNGYIYIAGGCTDSATCNNVTNNVQYAQLDSYGNVGAWADTTAPLPLGRSWGQLEVAGNTLYFIGGQTGAGMPSADVYYASPVGGNVTTWNTATNSLPAARTLHSAAVWDNRIFVTGGTDSTGAAQNTVYVSPQLNAGGNITTGWTNVTAFDVARSGLTAIAYANNLYVLGGKTGDTHLSDVQYAKINANGTLGDWSFAANLPMPIQQADGFAANGYMYLFGGRSGGTEADCQDRTYVAPISANTAIASGNNPTGLGSWYEASAQYGGVRYGIATAYHDGKAYLLGGGCAQILNQAEIYSTPGSHTFTAPVDTTNISVETWGGGGGGGNGENGGTNNAGSGGGGGGYARHTMPAAPGPYPLTVGAGGTAGAAGGGSWFNNATTVFGAGGSGGGIGTIKGLGGTGNVGSDATFNGGGGGGGHTAATPTNRRGGGGGGSAFYNANGNSGTDGLDSVGTGIGGTGTGNGGNGGVNTGAGAGGASPGAGGGGGGYRGLGGAGANGRVVVYYQKWTELVLTGNNRVTVATLASQPQVARYSYLIDTDTDVFPSTWLINGVDNNIGARWSLKYRSMNASDGIPTNCGSADMTSWGQETVFGEIALGQPGVYTARDESGANLNCARYYYLLLSIDSSRTYGYPDDVTRGPTITDLTLQFTANPSQRLMHGRTFTGGLQQPIDTPYYAN